jgi:hypothetical protein
MSPSELGIFLLLLSLIYGKMNAPYRLQGTQAQRQSASNCGTWRRRRPRGRFPRHRDDLKKENCISEFHENKNVWKSDFLPEISSLMPKFKSNNKNQCCGSGSDGSVYVFGPRGSGSVKSQVRFRILLLASKNSFKKPWFLLLCDFFLTFYLCKMIYSKCTVKK